MRGEGGKEGMRGEGAGAAHRRQARKESGRRGKTAGESVRGEGGREGETAGAAHRRQARKESGRSGKAAGRYILFC